MVRQTMQSHVAYADVSERHLSDYRSGVFPWLFALLFAANCSLLLVLPRLLGQTEQSVPALWVRLVICLGMLLIMLVGEICQRRVVTLPRLIVTTDPAVSRHADELLRVLVINFMYRGIVNNVRNYITLQWFFFLPWLLSSPSLLAGQLFVTFLWLLCWLPTVWPGQMMSAIYLGGRKTGWPWRKRSLVVRA
ncbi:hypothetical protein KSF_020860 [Reticulibacter mediterranei]|uniref:Uncharacterized protein n=1 Tax=Reticulibacter mediterranei TaxID=2778369 RepID=A0A8J3IGC1_9CHLR|nr:hypothetical protein [Reticulibacter mediterranei]GHO92038.1 hypothetical protein KSF_020860 [Reticulibacter mediterranei]